MKDKELIELSQSFYPMVPTGFHKAKIQGYDTTDPVIQRIPCIPAQSPLYESASYQFTQKSVNSFRLNGGCSAIGKRRFANYCCAASQQSGQPANGSDTRHTYAAQPNQTCPANKDLNNFLTSATNLYNRDANGHYHIWHMVIGLFTGQDTYIIESSAEKQSRRESSLKITKEKIAGMVPFSVEMGIWFPSGADFQSLERKKNHSIAGLANNSYLQQSTHYKSCLFEIANSTHRCARQFPNASQLQAMARYAYLKVKQNAWNSRTGFTLQARQKLKIYDPKFAWRCSEKILVDRVLLPPFCIMNTHVAGNVAPSEFVGTTEETKQNKILLEKVESKIYADCKNELFVPLDSHNMAELFQAHEFKEDSPRSQLASDYLIKNAARYPPYRAPQHVN